MGTASSTRTDDAPRVQFYPLASRRCTLHPHHFSRLSLRTVSVSRCTLFQGERALMHVPFSLGYGAAAQGSKGGAWYIPGSSNLLFDIEIVSKTGVKAPAKEEL